MLDAGAGQQLAPLAGELGVRDVDGLGVEGDERERRPATVTKVPAPSLSTLRRRSLPFWADIGGSLGKGGEAVQWRVA